MITALACLQQLLESSGR